MPLKTIVIIGASFSGTAVAKALVKDTPPTGIKVILINPSDELYFCIAAPRLLTKPAALSADKYLYSIPGIFKSVPRENFEFIQDTVRSMDTAAKIVTLANSTKSIYYDYLVIASGSSSQPALRGDDVVAPFKPTGADAQGFKAQIKSSQETIAAAKSIIVGGAGPLGVELAGELADLAKDVTIVTSTRILPMLNEGPSSTAEKLLLKKNVKVIKNSAVTEAYQTDDRKQWSVRLSTGKVLKADLYIGSTGVSPNNSFIPAEYLKDGWVNVDSYFRVAVPGKAGQSPEGVYAVGDITTHTPRTAIKVNDQVPIVVGNLKAAISGSSKLKAYGGSGGSIMMMVPVGENAGTGQMFGWTVWGKLVVMMKGKDFMTGRASGMVGA
ncbi:hypothetical protein BJX99DRAFT_237036 [Aspergillus californicus]